MTLGHRQQRNKENVNQRSSQEARDDSGGAAEPRLRWEHLPTGRLLAVHSTNLAVMKEFKLLKENCMKFATSVVKEGALSAKCKTLFVAKTNTAHHAEHTIPTVKHAVTVEPHTDPNSLLGSAEDLRVEHRFTFQQDGHQHTARANRMVWMKSYSSVRTAQSKSRTKSS